MTQILISISDPKEASLIRKILAKFDSVTISKPARKRKTGLDEALEDVAAGRVTRYESVEDFFKEMGLRANTHLKSQLNLRRTSNAA